MYIHFTIHQFSTVATSAYIVPNNDLLDKMGHLL